MTGGGGGGAGTTGGVLSATTSVEPSPLLNSNTSALQSGVPPSPAMSALGQPSSPALRPGMLGSMDKRGPRGSFSGAAGQGGGGGGHTPSRMLGGASGALAPRMSVNGGGGPGGGGGTAHVPPSPARVSQNGGVRSSGGGTSAAPVPTSQHQQQVPQASITASTGVAPAALTSTTAGGVPAAPAVGTTPAPPMGASLGGPQGSLERVTAAGASHSHGHLRKPADLAFDPSFSTVDPPPAPGGTSSRPASGQGHVPSTPSTPMASFPAGYSGPGSVRGVHHH
jgi:hypothetical protein